MFEKIEKLLETDAPLAAETAAGVTPFDLQMATGVCLVAAAKADQVLTPAEREQIVKALSRQFHLPAGEAAYTLNVAASLLKNPEKLGAFAEDCNATTNDIVGQLFRDKKAAMQLDGSWFANGIAESSWGTTAVMPFPAYAEDAEPTAFIGGVSMGFYLSRKAWDDPAKRDAAVSLLAYLASGDNAKRLGGFSFGGSLLEDSYTMLNNAKVMLSPFQDEMTAEARSLWFSKVPAIVDGTADPAAVWAEVMALNPFSK